MTPEFGAASQLEKIDMLDFADFVAINKFDRRGAEDALRDVRKQVQRNRQAFGQKPEDMPVYGTIASRFNDDGVTALYHAVAARLAEQGPEARARASCRGPPRRSPAASTWWCRRSARATWPRSPSACARYHRHAAEQARLARERQRASMRGEAACSERTRARTSRDARRRSIEREERRARCALARAARRRGPTTVQAYAGDEYVVNVRGREIAHAA